MGYLRYARYFILIALVVWCVFLIHPFTPEGIVITDVSGEAALGLRRGDYVETINDIPIESIEDFENAIAQINPDDTVSVNARRETFPYSYTDVRHSYIAGEKNNETDIKFYVGESTFSNLIFSYELAGGNKYIINSNQTNAAELIETRLEINNIDDFSVYEEENKIIVETSSKRDLTRIIETRGEFEAQIGGEPFFNTEDVESVCVDGIDCVIAIYQDINETEDERNIVWKYEFEVFIENQAAERFANLTEDLSIAHCRADICVLNETINYYIDGELIGSEEILDNQKGIPYESPKVSGMVSTSEEAQRGIRLAQSSLKGELNANVEEITESEPRYQAPLFNYTLYGVIGLIVLSGIISFMFLKKPRVSLTGIFTGLSELIIALGVLAGLNFVINVQTLAGLSFMGLVVIGYQNYSTYRFKKEGIIFRKIKEFSKDLNKWLLIAIGIFFVLLFIVRDFSTPILVQLVIILLLTKAIFFKSIKK